jgi:hypothetical protein
VHPLDQLGAVTTANDQQLLRERPE